jgi:outer membrane protein assembly factor BamB
MDIRPLLRILAVAALVVAGAAGICALRKWPSRRMSGIIAGVLAALAVAGFVLSSLNLLEPRAPLPDSVTLYYTSTDDNALEAAAAATGLVRWRYALGINADWPPVLDDGTVYIGVRASIHAVRASDGKQRWVAAVEGRADSETPAVANGVVYVTSTRGVSALRASDGSLPWYTPWGEGVDVISSPRVAAGVVYAALGSVGTSSNLRQTTIVTVHALRASDGAIIWKHTVPGTADVTLAVGAGVVCVRSLEELAALDASSGTLLWQRRGLGSDIPPAVAGALVYAGVPVIGGPQGDAVLALNARDGSERWHTTVDHEGAGVVPITVEGDTLYAGADGVSALRASDGHILWQSGSGAQFGQPMIADGVVFVTSSKLYTSNTSLLPPFSMGDYLNALDARSGALYWRSPGNVTLAPGVSN